MDLSAKDGVLPGQEYTVFRKGEVFRHPASGKPLGRYEETLGYAQVRRVEPTFAEALFVPIEGKPQPRPEDGVRITRGRVRVALVPPTDLTKGNADLRRVPFMKGLDIKPMISTFQATGLTSTAARQGRGGVSILAGGPFAPMDSSKSRRRSSPARRRKGLETSSCRAGSSRGPSTRCPSRPSSSSSF